MGREKDYDADGSLKNASLVCVVMVNRQSAGSQAGPDFPKLPLLQITSRAGPERRVVFSAKLKTSVS
jgi:hypothetical protein